ncbi:hypothetical protein CAPTEDRAFT_173595 [Capitella teleta]|uniref:Saposin A-type domain-containing protein n=1 Tax=Capitella teleta TaxID=283909 RepID=X1ZD55_CAPTE|nr:hypothetical protein CAPTEDRAFT_173595 [Capitella teleta]|eukprot:ELU04646.1 hypothetical protein CAPTEDRAFT_173595 [Capitella teleta]
MKLLIIAFCVNVAHGSSVISSKPCSNPIEEWCSSEEIAKKCQVLDACLALNRLNTAEAVAIDLYFESLCPGCRAFLTGQLWPTFKALGKDIINISLVPYGNAQQTLDHASGMWKFTCQHGGSECVGNIIETCAIVMYKDIEKYFPFVHCLESSSDVASSGERVSSYNFSVQFNLLLLIKCANLTGLDWGKISTCATGADGNTLEHLMGLKTQQLNPPHEYVPWIVVQGSHTDELQNKAQRDLKSLVCSLYKGSKPESCTQA